MGEEWVGIFNWRRTDWPLLALKMKEGVHEPRDVVSSRNWEWSSVYRQQGNGYLGPTTARNSIFPVTRLSRKWVLP